MLHVYWPMCAFVTLFIIVGVIIILLRFGPRICKTRHTTLPDDVEWKQKTYEQPLSHDVEIF